MKNIYKLGIAGAVLMPFVTFAQTTWHGPSACTTYTLACLVAKIIDYFQLAVTLIIGLAFLTFVWNVYQYFFTEKDKKEAGMYVLYSVIGFFVILSIWGLVAVLRNTLNLPSYQPNWPFNSVGGGSGGGTGPFGPTGTGYNPSSSSGSQFGPTGTGYNPPPSFGPSGSTPGSPTSNLNDYEFEDSNDAANRNAQQIILPPDSTTDQSRDFESTNDAANRAEGL